MEEPSDGWTRSSGVWGGLGKHGVDVRIVSTGTVTGEGYSEKGLEGVKQTREESLKRYFLITSEWR